jgi:hypothetical protein
MLWSHCQFFTSSFQLSQYAIYNLSICQILLSLATVMHYKHYKTVMYSHQLTPIICHSNAIYTLEICHCVLLPANVMHYTPCKPVISCYQISKKCIIHTSNFSVPPINSQSKVLHKLKTSIFLLTTVTVMHYTTSQTVNF